MKLNYINSIINESLTSEVKKRILKEQESKSVLNMFTSLTPLYNNITHVEDIGSDGKFGVLINIEGISEEDFIKCCNSQSIEDAQRKLNTNLDNDLSKNNMDQNHDIDISIESNENNNFNIIIKILSAEPDEMTENMKEVKKGKLIEAINFARKNKIKSKKPCDECGDQLEQIERISEKTRVNEVSPGTYILSKATDDATKSLRKKLGRDPSKSEIRKEVKKILDKENNKSEKKESCDECNKSKKIAKKTMKISESKLIEMITRILIKDEKTKAQTDLINKIKNIISEEIPGLAAVHKAHTGDKKEEDEYFGDVGKKMDDYLDFEGNDDPEFPHQIGKGDKVARQNTEKEDEFLELNRGRGPQDLNYDNDNEDDNGEPSKEFVERLKKSLIGDPTMGNASKDTLNTISSDVGDNMFKTIKKRQDAKRKEPRYPKEPVPVKDVPESKVTTNVNEDIMRMKEISVYGKKIR